MFLLTGNLAIETEDDISLLIFMVFVIGGVGGFNLVRNGFSEIGEATKKEYYKATYSESSSDVSITNHSYNAYSAEQWIKIIVNILIFVFGCAVTVFLGPIVYAKKLWNYSQAKKRHKDEFKHDLSPSEMKVTTEEIASYRGLLAQKALDTDEVNYSVIEGVKMKHTGYLFHGGSLYGAIQTNLHNDVFQTNAIYFIKLFKTNNNYEVVDIELPLYDKLYDLFSGIDEPESKIESKSKTEPEPELERDNGDDLVSKILDPDNDENLFLVDENGTKVEFEQVAMIPRNDDIYVILKPTKPFELGMTEDNIVIFSIEVQRDGEKVLAVVQDQATIEWVDRQFQKMLRR